MQTITIRLPDDAVALAEKHARELGYPDASDYAFELLRNFVAGREDALYQRMHAGEHNPVFGRSRREQQDADARVTPPPTPARQGVVSSLLSILKQ